MLKICFINFINYFWPPLAAHCHQSVSFLSALNSTNAANASEPEGRLSRFAGGVDDWNSGMVSASGHLSGDILVAAAAALSDRSFLAQKCRKNFATVEDSDTV